MVAAATLYEEHERGASYGELARKYGMNRDGIRGRISKYRRKRTPALQVVQREKAPLPRIDTYVYTGQTPHTALPVFTGQLDFDLSEAVIAGDFHSPTLNLSFTETMCRFAERNIRGRPVLLIVGDLINGDKDSAHAPHLVPVSREQELDIACQLFDYLFGYFEVIYMTLGNHIRKRLFNTLASDLSMAQFARLFTTKPDRLHITPYDEVFVTSGGLKWVFTHQYEYSKNKLTKANDLAQKYQRCVGTFHQHHTAIGMDRYERYVCIDIGGMHEQTMMAYPNLVPNTMPRMNSGFLYLEDGTANLLTPYKGMTNWGRWLPGVDVPLKQAA